jgi:hypothetical protein
LYTTSLLYHLLHNLNHFTFQYEQLILLLEASPDFFFERVISRNLTLALTRRLLNNSAGAGANPA